MKIYTRTGDAGTTSLVGGKRVSKASLRLESYGTIDELNSFIGLLATEPDLTEETSATLRFIQNKLFNVGAYLATDNADAPFTEPAGLGHEAISRLEREIDLMDDRLPQLRAFILPGGCHSAALANVARTVCRRAERRVIALCEEARVDELILRFLNRLSDYLFILGRFNNYSSNTPEITWEKDG